MRTEDIMIEELSEIMNDLLKIKKTSVPELRSSLLNKVIGEIKILIVLLETNKSKCPKCCEQDEIDLTERE